MTQVDTSKWSGEGEFTQSLIDTLKTIDAVAFVRVEDAPSTRSEADYNFVSNELYVAFARARRAAPGRWLGVIPVRRTIEDKAMTLADLDTVLTSRGEIGPPDYSDESMLQYLRTERIIPPYQTKGYKLVELVRIYEVDARSR